MINKIKFYIRQFLLKKGLTIHRFKIEKYLYPNVFNTSFHKNVLVCHYTAVFENGIKLTHTAYAECWEICNVFKELGYNVDVVNYDRWLAPNEIDINKYDIFLGQGNSFESIFYYDISGKVKIHYATGLDFRTVNKNTIKRLNDFKVRNGVFLPNSTFIVKSQLNLQSSFSDYIFMWGNEFGLTSYEINYKNNLSSLKTLPAFFYKTVDNYNFNLSGKDFLWIGSSGLIHRGLDITLEYFIKNQNLTLHVLGNVKIETEFWNYYKDKVTPNIIFYNFVDISSSLFSNIINKCTFQVYLSCAEGTSASVLTGVGNGGLIPIITKECCFEPNLGEIIIEEINYSSLSKSINYALSLDNEEVLKRRQTIYNFVNSFHTKLNYSQTLKKYLNQIICQKEQ